MRFIGQLACAGVSMIALSGVAYAQDTAPEDTASSDDIVVTGTLIRGIAPGGSQSIGVDQEKIASIGATTTSDLIANLPQTGQFLGFVGVRGSSNFSLSVNRPSLRYLGGGSSSGSPTLLLLDGHRMPGMGITQSSADLDAISPGAIERVEVVTDGGSATYGSDAIGGVMNFVTRRKFDGVEVRGNVGFADDYMQYNAGVTAGFVGSAVSAYVAYDYSYHDELYGRDRDWSQSRDWVNGLPSSNNCAVGNLRAGGITYALPAVTAGFGNRCDPTEDATFYPRETKHSVFGRLLFEPGGPASFEISAYYVNRKNTSNGEPLNVATGSTVTPATLGAAPFFALLPPGTTTATLLYDLSPVLGKIVPQATRMESYGITPAVKIDVGGDWQINAMMNYGIGKSNFRGQLVNSAPITAAINNGTFNPFNLTAPGNATVLSAAPGQALDQYQYGRATHQMMNARVVGDGPLFDLPGGAVRVAVGAEYYWEKYTGNNGRQLTGAQLAALPDLRASRTVKSVFGEISIPIIGEGSGPFHSLTLSAAGRYDDYSDFGSTFNPKLGVNFEPVEWLTLRGNWGKSFQAPGISDIALGVAPSFNVLSLATRPFSDPSRPPPTDGSRPVFIAFGGTITPLSPQTANTWSLGFDLKPTLLEGFAAGLTYYNIDFKGVIGIPPIFNPTVFYRDFAANNVVYTAGDAALQAYFNQLAAQGASNTQTTLNLIGNSFAGVYGILDSRTQNLARIKTSGLDFYLRYNHETNFGSIYADFSGTYILNFRQQSSPTAALVDTLSLDTTKLRTNTTIGANVGNLRAQVTWNFSQGYATTPTVANLQQNRVGSYHVFNLFMQYKVPGDSTIAKDLAFTLNIDNLFDTDPPLFRGATNSLFGVANGFTLGRVVKLGVSKKF